MNYTAFESGGNVYVHRECIAGYAFKVAAIGDSYALFTVICAGLSHLEDTYARPHCIERLSPCISPA